MIMDSHLDIEKRKQEELGVDVSEEMKDNSDLAEKGREVIHSSITRYGRSEFHVMKVLVSSFYYSWLRVAFPVVPEEMITELRDYLLSEPIMADVAFHIGLREIVLSEEYPPAAATLMKCFEAVVGALASSQPERAAKLVTDLVASQLHGKEVQEICSESLANPMRILEGILSRSGLEAPEARLLFQTGINYFCGTKKKVEMVDIKSVLLMLLCSGPDTILASHLVGVYCNKEIIGQSYGETLEIAEEMAARDALRNIFQTAEHSAPRPFGRDTVGGDTPHADMGSMALEPRNIVNC